MVTLLNDFCFALCKSFFSGLLFVCSFVLFSFSSDEMSFRLIFRFSHSRNPFLTPAWMAPTLFFRRYFLFWMPLFYLLWSAKSRHLLNTTYLHSNDTVFHFRKQSIPYELEKLLACRWHRAATDDKHIFQRFAVCFVKMDFSIPFSAVRRFISCWNTWNFFHSTPERCAAFSKQQLLFWTWAQTIFIWNAIFTFSNISTLSKY